ncbi:MAG: gp16 family protein [Thiohalospira sp.]
MSDQRRRELAAIHTAARELGLDEDAYRDLLEGQTGQRSAGQLDAAMRQKVLERMKALGWNPQPGRRRPNPARGRRRQLDKIEALLADIARLQGRPVPWQYADAIAARVCGVDRVEWVATRDLNKIIAALTYQQRRLAAADQITE